MRLLILLPLALLAGCSTTLTDRQVEAMHTPTITLNCEAGCSASYTDPRDRPQMPTNGWDTANRAISTAGSVITSVAPWAAVGVIATDGIRNAGDRSVDGRDQSVRTDSTHEPTVVEHPEPTIITQPEPVIVPQPAD